MIAASKFNAEYEPRDEVEESQDLIAEIREQLDRAEAVSYTKLTLPTTPYA